MQLSGMKRTDLAKNVISSFFVNFCKLGSISRKYAIKPQNCEKKHFTSKPPFQQLQAELKFLLESFTVVLFEKIMKQITKLFCLNFMQMECASNFQFLRSKNCYKISFFAEYVLDNLVSSMKGFRCSISPKIANFRRFKVSGIYPTY